MYAVVASGGKQYKVREGEVLRVEKLAGDVGAEVAFDEVLLLSDGENVEIGRPVLPDVQVKGHIVEQGKARKIIVFKYKRRKRYRRKQGRREDRLHRSLGSRAQERQERAPWHIKSGRQLEKRSR